MCGDVSLYNMRIKSDCSNFQGHQCKDASVRIQCLSSESLSVHSNVTSYQHSAMPGTKYVEVETFTLLNSVKQKY